MKIKLNIYNPAGDKDHPPHPSQLEYLNKDRSGPGVTLTHNIAGRGGSKTVSGLILMTKCALVTHKGVTGFWTEPRAGDFERTFLPSLRKHIPGEGTLWKLVNRRGASWLEWCTGSRTDLLSLNVDNPKKALNRGPSYGYGFIDEAALGFKLERFNDLMAAVRGSLVEGQGPKFIDCLTTPQANGYRLLYADHPDRVIRYSSYDNPYLDKADLDSIAEHMSPEYIQQELYGQDVMLSGRIWKHFKEELFPKGNLIDIAWDPYKPWWLSCDLGSSQGSYQIIQQTRIEGTLIDVVVGEILANDMIFSSVLSLVDREYAQQREEVTGHNGRPVKVFIGHDVNTKGNDSPAASLALKQWGWQYWYPKGLHASKEIQLQVATGRIYNSVQGRLFCVSTKLRRHEHLSGGKPKQRGILEMFRTDTFPDAKTGLIFNKDKKILGKAAIEDDRDCFLYGQIGLHPPQWLERSNKNELR